MRTSTRVVALLGLLLVGSFRDSHAQRPPTIPGVYPTAPQAADIVHFYFYTVDPCRYRTSIQSVDIAGSDISVIFRVVAYVPEPDNCFGGVPPGGIGSASLGLLSAGDYVVTATSPDLNASFVQTFGFSVRAAPSVVPVGSETSVLAACLVLFVGLACIQRHRRRV